MMSLFGKNIIAAGGRIIPAITTKSNIISPYSTLKFVGRCQKINTNNTNSGLLMKTFTNKPLLTSIGGGSIRRFTNFNGYRGGGFSKRAGQLGKGLAVISSLCGIGYFAWDYGVKDWFYVENAKRIVQIDYNQVYKSIEDVMFDAELTSDDGTYAPIFIRLAWHASGTYDKETKTGGSSKATMRFIPEKDFEANRGLDIARDRLEIVKKKFPMISYGDLWTLAGVCAIQEMAGPIIPWRPGRVDGKAEDCPPDGRLPDGKNDSPQHPRDIFYRMGFDDKEIVCLIGAHGVGRCHKSRSGFDGPWTFSPTTFSNQFYVQLVATQWKEKPNWSGNKQFEDESGSLMMMPADLVFKKDPVFMKWVEYYAASEKRFFCDFAIAFKKLLELGVEFPSEGKTYKFKPLRNH